MCACGWGGVETQRDTETDRETQKEGGREGGREGGGGITRKARQIALESIRRTLKPPPRGEPAATAGKGQKSSRKRGRDAAAAAAAAAAGEPEVRSRRV